MSIETAFWILIVIVVLELFTIYVLAGSIRKVLHSDFFKKNIDSNNKGASNSGTIASIAIFLLASLTPSFAMAADVTSADSGSFIDISRSLVYVIAIFTIILLAVIFYLKGLLSSSLNFGGEATSESKLMHSLTGAVAIEDEHKIDMGHEYDGIRELDNNLPPWWLYMFYGTIIFAVIYLVQYHVTKSADLQLVEYEKSMTDGDAEVQAYLKSQNLSVDETSVTLLTEASDLSEGADLYAKNCVACHKSKGEGQIGPNLTDEYWLHGGDIKDVFKTITYGVDNTAMKFWKDDFNPVQIQKISSYILSLDYVSPEEGGMEPAGDKVGGGSASSNDSGDATTDDSVATEALAISDSPEDIAAGKTIFESKCIACHLPGAIGGAIGPNLTDDFWKHGGSAADISKTITEGVTGTAMMKWKGQLQPDEINQVISYIMSLDEVTPADGGKEPEGDKYTP